MKQHPRHLLPLALLLAACTAERAPSAPPPLLPLPVPAAIGGPLVADHTVISRFRDQVLTCRGLFRISAEKADLVCLDALGQRALALAWDGAGPRLEATPPGLELPPAAVAGEIAATFAPRDVLQPLYARAGLTLVDTDSRRLILIGDRPLVEIVYDPDFANRWAGRSVLFNHLTGHSVEVRSHRIGP